MDLSTICDKESGLRIRPVDASNIGDLIRIGDAANLSPWSAQGYLDEMKNADAIMLRLVDENNLTIGFIVGRLVVGGEIDIRHDAEIYNIAVIDAEQRRGHGQRLIDAFIAKCRGSEVCNIWLEVREGNSSAIAFYEKNGFAAVQTRRSFYENPREHALLMKLILKEQDA